MLFKLMVDVVLPVSIWLALFSLGAKASAADVASLLRQPGRLARAMAAMFAVVPAFAIALSLIFGLQPEIKFALVALSASPIPAALHLKQTKLGARDTDIVGLLVAASLVSLIATPLLVGFAARLLGSDVAIAPLEVARIVAESIAFPLAAGIALRRTSPRTAELLSPYASAAANVMLGAGVAAVLFVSWPALMAELKNGAGAAIAATAIVGLIGGHLLGTHDGRAYTALALAAATRHPGIAIAMGTAHFPTSQKTITAAVLLFLFVSGVVTSAYVQWMKHRRKLGALHLELR